MVIKIQGTQLELSGGEGSSVETNNYDSQGV